MPLDQSPAKVPEIIEIRTPGTNKKVRYEKHEKLGEGVFSDVYRVSDNQGHCFALKVIKLDNSHLSSSDRVVLMRLIKKEAVILNKLGMLQGLKIYKNSALILQPYIQGKVAKERIIDNIHLPSDSWPESSWEENNKIIKECFLRLLELHDKNIVHMDPHWGNYIYDAENKNPILVDFGFAQKKNKYNSIKDSELFYSKINDVAQLNGDPNFESTLFGHYSEHVIKNIKEHKVEIAFKIFAYGVVSVAAIYGLGTFAAARMLMWAYCKTISLDFATDMFISILEREQAQLVAQKCTNGGQDSIGQKMAYTVKHGRLIVAALLFWGIYRGYQSPMELIQKLLSLTAENSPLSQAFWSSALNSISALEVGNAALFYYPASNAYTYMSELFEVTFSTEKSLADDCENITHNIGWVSYFQSYIAKDDVTQSNVNIPSKPKFGMI